MAALGVAAEEVGAGALALGGAAAGAEQVKEWA